MIISLNNNLSRHYYFNAQEHANINFIGYASTNRAYLFYYSNV